MSSNLNSYFYRLRRDPLTDSLRSDVRSAKVQASQQEAASQTAGLYPLGRLVKFHRTLPRLLGHPKPLSLVTQLVEDILMWLSWELKYCMSVVV